MKRSIIRPIRPLVAFLVAFSCLVFALESILVHPALAATKGAGNLQTDPESESFDGNLGINNINYVLLVPNDIVINDPGRAEMAQNLGAAWNRVALYWYDVEQYNDNCPNLGPPPAPLPEDQWKWTEFDKLVNLNESYNTQTLFILMGVQDDVCIDACGARVL